MNTQTIIKPFYATDGSQQVGECIAHGKEEGFRYYVITGEKTAHCYIDVTNTQFNKETNYETINLSVNGGLIFAGTLFYTLYNIEQVAEWCIGWDYEHYYNFGIVDNSFSTAFLVKECQEACRNLKKLLTQPIYGLTELSTDILHFINKKDYSSLLEFNRFAEEVVNSDYCNSLKIKLLKLLKEEKISYILKKEQEEIDSLLEDILRITF